jgi:hypothetical protein
MAMAADRSSPTQHFIDECKEKIKVIACIKLRHDVIGDVI